MTDWLRGLPDAYRRLAAAVALFGAGIATAFALMGFIALPERMAIVEDWQVVHDSTVTAPQTEAIQDLRRRVSAIPEIQRMVYELWCDRFPDRCQATPASEGQ